MLTINKRILIFSLAYFPVEGGAEIATKEIADRLPDIKFDMVTKKFEQSHRSFERVGNVNVYRLNSAKLFFPFKAYWFARNLHKQKPYDAIWSIMAAHAGLAAALFKIKFPDIKFILTLQEGDPFGYLKRRAIFVWPLFKKIFTQASIVQVISNYLEGYARQMGYRGKIEVIPNGVDVKKFENVRSRAFDKNKVVLITTSRLVKKNGVGDIIEALKFLPESISLQVLGIGPLESELKLQTTNYKLQTRVEFLGHIPYGEIPKHLHEADIFIRPSLSEGFGNSFIEAMVAGLPVIATPVGGIVDFLESGSTGLFCEVHNPQSIAKQVERLIADEPLRERIILNASSMVCERYQWDLIAREMKTRVFDILTK